MSNELRIFIILCVICFILITLNTLRNKTLTTKQALLWIFISCIMAIGVLFPKFVVNLSEFAGFEESSNMVFFIAIFLLLLMLYYMSLVISKQKRDIITLIQHVSLLEYKVENETRK